MSAQPVEADDGWSRYEVALTAVSVAAIAETGAVFDRLVPPGVLVEELPERVRALLVTSLVRSWLAYRARAASLASVMAAGWLSGERGEVVEPLLPPPPSADRDRLRQAAKTVLDRAADMAVRADHADARPLPEQSTLEADIAAVQARRAQEAADLVDELRRQAAESEAAWLAERDAEAAEADAELAAIRKQEAEEERAEREAIEALRRADAAAAAEEARRDAAVLAESERADREAEAADRARQRAIEEEFYRARREARDQRRAEADAARREARRERREAQRRRAERVARGEVAEGAAETLREALAPAPEAVGWVRKLDPDPCERCVAWWKSGGDPKAASPVRPYSIRMKRHNGCQCVQRPVTQEEADARGWTNEREPVYRNKSRDRRARRADGTV